MRHLRLALSCCLPLCALCFGPSRAGAQVTATYTTFGRGCPGSNQYPLCAGHNFAGGQLRTAKKLTLDEFAYELTAPADMVVSGFNLFTKGTTLVSFREHAALYLATKAGTPEQTAAATGELWVSGTTPAFHRAVLRPAVRVAKGSKLFLAATHFGSHPSDLTAGAGARTFLRDYRVRRGWTVDPVARRPSFSVICRHVPAMIANPPLAGKPFVVTLRGARDFAPAVLVFGLSNKSWGPFRLPLSLAFVGGPGCELLASADFFRLGVTDVTGTLVTGFLIPRSWPLGLTFHNQFSVFDPTVNPLRLVFSNGGTGKVGDR